ncbi:hypothetical protein ACW9KT_11930 [Hymenobacter sp. HD11105]
MHRTGVPGAVTVGIQVIEQAAMQGGAQLMGQAVIQAPDQLEIKLVVFLVAPGHVVGVVVGACFGRAEHETSALL